MLTVITSMNLSASADSHGSPRKKPISEYCVKTVTRWCRSEWSMSLAQGLFEEPLPIDGDMDVEVAVWLAAFLRLF